MNQTITLPRSVVEQALETLTNCTSEYGHRCNRCDSEVDPDGNVASALRAALEQPQVEQEPVAWYDGRKFYGSQAAASMNMANMAVLAPLYTHSQNLNCKSNQARLATLWGYVKEQPRQPMTDADIGVYVSKEMAEYTAGAYADYGGAKSQLIHFARAIERAQGIGGEA